MCSWTMACLRYCASCLITAPLSVHLHIGPLGIYLSACLVLANVCSSVCLSVYLFICLQSAHLHACDDRLEVLLLSCRACWIVTGVL